MSLETDIKFQVLSHFERCPGFNKKRCVKNIPVGVIFKAIQLTKS